MLWVDSSGENLVLILILILRESEFGWLKDRHAHRLIYLGCIKDLTREFGNEAVDLEGSVILLLLVNLLNLQVAFIVHEEFDCFFAVVQKTEIIAVAFWRVVLSGLVLVGFSMAMAVAMVVTVAVTFISVVMAFFSVIMPTMTMPVIMTMTPIAMTMTMFPITMIMRVLVPLYHLIWLQCINLNRQRTSIINMRIACLLLW